jgi:PAS domain-containing protein
MDIKDIIAKENLERLKQITMALEAKEKEAVDSDKKLNFVIEKAGIGIWVWNVRTNTLKWNDNMFKIFGKDKATFNGEYSDFGDCLHPDDKERIDEILLSNLPFTKDKYSVSYKIVWPNGNVRKIIARGIFINDNEIYGLCIDVTNL